MAVEIDEVMPADGSCALTSALYYVPQSASEQKLRGDRRVDRHQQLRASESPSQRALSPRANQPGSHCYFILMISCLSIRTALLQAYIASVHLNRE